MLRKDVYQRVTDSIVAEQRRLPPDPEGQNDERAAWAKVALDAFMQETATDLDDAVTDLLCDLMHWCDRNNQDFESALNRAQNHYHEETLTEEAAA